MKENKVNHCKGILIVEDDEGIRDILKTALELEGHKVFTAENGQVGLDLLSKLPKPCLILLDLMMPVMNGWQFATALENDSAMATIPVVIVSAYSDKAASIKSKAIIKKPININALYEEVKKWCPLEKDMKNANSKNSSITE